MASTNYNHDFYDVMSVVLVPYNLTTLLFFYVSLPIELIKQVTLSHLRSYYRFRSRTGSMQSALDMQTDSGELVDAIISFEISEGKTFTSAIEITDENRNQEVFFSLHRRKLMWDCIMLSCIVLATLLSLSFAFNFVDIKQTSWIGMAIAFDVFALILYYVFYATLNKLDTYRYIYAIEQFKLYKADEQWISLDSGIFSHKNEVQFEELKRQCVTNGIGLLLVHDAEHAQLLMTPARVSKNALSSRIKTFLSRPTQRPTVEQFIRPVGQVAEVFDFEKYQSKNFTMQKFGTAIAAIIVIGIMFKYSQNTDEVRSMDSIWSDSPAKLTTPESEEFLFEDDSNAVVASNANVSVNENPPELYLKTAGGWESYEADRIFDGEASMWIVKDGEFDTFEDAKTRIQMLEHVGIPANIIKQSIIDSGKLGFAVFIDDAFDNEKDAAKAARSYKEKLNKKDLQNFDLTIVEMPATVQ